MKSLFSKTYITHVIERNSLNKDKDVLEELLNIIFSSNGSLSNPTKLFNTFNSIKKYSISASTINNYLEKFIDAFILHKVYRYYNELIIREFDIDVDVVEYNFKDEFGKKQKNSI